MFDCEAWFRGSDNFQGTFMHILWFYIDYQSVWFCLPRGVRDTHGSHKQMFSSWGPFGSLRAFGFGSWPGQPLRFDCWRTALGRPSGCATDCTGGPWIARVSTLPCPTHVGMVKRACKHKSNVCFSHVKILHSYALQIHRLLFSFGKDKAQILCAYTWQPCWNDNILKQKHLLYTSIVNWASMFGLFRSFWNVFSPWQVWSFPLARSWSLELYWRPSVRFGIWAKALESVDGVTPVEGYCTES